MISAYVSDGGKLKAVEQFGTNIPGIVWFDLYEPTREEEAAVEEALGIDVPLREDMEEIEISSRLYQENNAAYMTAILPARTDSDDPHMAPVTFVLSSNRLLTVRYHEPRAFQTFTERARRVPMGANTGESLLIALLEAHVDRLADVLEWIGRDITQISRDVFRRPGAKTSGGSNFQLLLEAIGRKGDLTSNIRDCLGTLVRMIGFLAHVSLQSKNEQELRARIGTLANDSQSIIDHATFLTQKVTFLLDATLGLINIEQNATIKIFSVVAVVFLPPTLIASIYGMNFDFMPELAWPLGYPLALSLMVASAVLPYWFFKRRHWL
jgi:magnesium transporter